MSISGPLPPTHALPTPRAASADLLPGVVVAVAATAVMVLTRLLVIYTDVLAGASRPVSDLVVVLPILVAAVGVLALVRTPSGVLGGAVILAAAATLVGLMEWQTHLIETRTQSVQDLANTLRQISWLSALTPPVLIVLGWGLARRHGALWWLSLVATLILAVIVKEVGDHALRAVLPHGLRATQLVSIGLALLGILSVVGGALAGWLLERSESPSGAKF